MTCESVRAQLTAYLDGELADERGSAVRGHLRGCEACRVVAGTEAAVRDGLRSLPPVDPPPSLWAGVQARLAAAEVADAERPGWRRLLQRLAPRAPQIGFAGLAIAAAIIFIVVRAQGRSEPVAAKPPAPAPTHVVIAPDKQDKQDEQDEQAPAPVPAEAGDVTAELAAAPAQTTQGYADAVKELLAAAQQERASWTPERKHEVETHVSAFQHEVDTATTERGKQKAYRSMIRYLQRAVIRDDIALASTERAP